MKSIKGHLTLLLLPHIFRVLCSPKRQMLAPPTAQEMSEVKKKSRKLLSTPTSDSELKKHKHRSQLSSITWAFISLQNLFFQQSLNLRTLLLSLVFNRLPPLMVQSHNPEKNKSSRVTSEKVHLIMQSNTSLWNIIPQRFRILESDWSTNTQELNLSLMILPLMILSLMKFSVWRRSSMSLFCNNSFQDRRLLHFVDFINFEW